MNMKKIAIFTLNGYFNYGNRLQNYALQEALKSLGFNVETVINNTKYINKKNKLISTVSKIHKLKTMPLREIYTKLNGKISNYLYKNKADQERTEVFKGFSSLYIVETDYSVSEDNIPNDFSSRYDYFVTGSDQVWNPNFGNRSSIYFLTFAPQNKRIAYAPSFGISKFPQEYKENYKVWLSEMSRISVRENAGAKIIKDLTGRDANVLVDPTLLLTKEKWLSISNIPANKPMKKYLLTYFLGPVSKERKSMIKSIATKNDLEIINLANKQDKVAYLAGPSEFIDYINSASVFCTDSFHGVVFSILMETAFVVFERKDNLQPMNSRIDTLLVTFNLQSRLEKNIKNNQQIFEVDYSHIAPILASERKKSFDYLKEALDVNE